jgi:CheY-like chemotaxis protein
LDVIGGLAVQHGVILESELGRQLPAIHGNRTLLRQILLKALSDSVTQPGTRRVCLRIYDEGQRIVVELTAEQSKPDRQPDNQAAPALDAVCRLVEMMGGMWQGAEVSTTGWMCRFDFPSNTQQVLLAVEDNEAVIEAFRRYLAGYDYQVVGAATGGEALRLARELHPAVITLDIMMPAQDGWEILQALKNDPATRPIPVIICSVLDDPELAHSLGAFAYLRKPITQAELLLALARLPAQL